jgi:hypothetical protein
VSVSVGLVVADLHPRGRSSGRRGLLFLQGDWRVVAAYAAVVAGQDLRVLLVGPPLDREPRFMPFVDAVRSVERQPGQQQKPQHDGEDLPEHHDKTEREQQYNRCAATAAFAAHGCGT